MPAADFLLLGLYPTALCACIGTDLGRRIIPNAAIVCLIAGFAALALLTPLPDLAARLVVSGAVTAAGFSLFAENLVGAGDAKLAGALMLWVDPTQVPLFVLLCGLLGGALALALARLGRGRGSGGAPSLPYGVALAGAGLALHPFSSLMGG